MEVICLTISEGECRSMTRLWILIWNLSQVLEPSPQGVFLVVILRVLVGILTGPFTFNSLSLAPLIRSWHLLQGLHIPGGEGDPDPVDRRLLLNSLSILVCGHDFGRVSDSGQRSPALNLSTSCRSESSNKSLVAYKDG